MARSVRLGVGLCNRLDECAMRSFEWLSSWPAPRFGSAGRHDGRMLALTLDTSCVIHAAQSQTEAMAVERLVDAARNGQVVLWLAAAFNADLSRASSEHARANMKWLESRPVNQRMPGPFRLDYSVLGGSDVLASDDAARVTSTIEGILLSEKYQAGNLDSGNDSFMDRWRRKINDVQHLAAHYMAGHDAFVTTDFDDMVKKREELWTHAGIRVLTPKQALEFIAPSEPTSPSRADR